MSKTIFYRLFRIGRIPQKLRPVLESEGLAVWDEGIPGRTVLRHFKAPGRRSTYRLERFSGSLAVTGRRVVGFAYSRPVINVPLDDPRLARVGVALVKAAWIELSFEAQLFHADWRGSIRLGYRTPLAARFLSCLGAHCRTQGPPAAARTHRRPHHE